MGRRCDDEEDEEDEEEEEDDATAPAFLTERGK